MSVTANAIPFSDVTFYDHRNALNSTDHCAVID